MNTITHEGNEYHVYFKSGGSVKVINGYRELGNDFVEIITSFVYDHRPDFEDIELSKVHLSDIDKIKSHREYMAEIEAQEGQEELEHEHREAIA